MPGFTASLAAIAAAAITASPALAGAPGAFLPVAAEVCEHRSSVSTRELSPEEAAQLLQAARELVTSLTTIVGDDRAAQLGVQLRSMGITPAVASGWRQQAHDLADTLLPLTANDPGARRLAVTLAATGISPTPADLRRPSTEHPAGQPGAGSGVTAAAQAGAAAAAQAGAAAGSNGPLVTDLRRLQRDEPDTGSADAPDTGTADDEAHGDQPTPAGLTEHSATADEQPGGDPDTTSSLQTCSARPEDPETDDGERAGDQRTPGTGDDEPSSGDDPAASLTDPEPSPDDSAGSDSADRAGAGEDRGTAPETNDEPIPGEADTTPSGADSEPAGWERQAADLADTLARAQDPEAAELAERLTALGVTPDDDAAAGDEAGQDGDAEGTASAGSEPDAEVGTDSPAATGPAGAGPDRATDRDSSPETEGDVSTQPDADEGETAGADSAGSWEQHAEELAAALADVDDDPAAAALAEKLAGAGIAVPEPDSASAAITTEPGTAADRDTGGNDDSAPDGADIPSGSEDETNADAAADPRLDPEPAPADSAPDPEPALASDAGGEPVAAVWDRLATCESGGAWDISTGNGYHGVIRTDQGQDDADHCPSGLGGVLSGIWTKISAVLLSRSVSS